METTEYKNYFKQIEGVERKLFDLSFKLADAKDERLKNIPDAIDEIETSFKWVVQEFYSNNSDQLSYKDLVLEGMSTNINKTGNLLSETEFHEMEEGVTDDTVHLDMEVYSRVVNRAGFSVEDLILYFHLILIQHENLFDQLEIQELSETSQKPVIQNSEIAEKDLEILRHIIDGKTQKEIPPLVYMSEANVKRRIGMLLEKYEFTHVTQLAVYCVRKNLL